MWPKCHRHTEMVRDSQLDILWKPTEFWTTTYFHQLGENILLWAEVQSIQHSSMTIMWFYIESEYVLRTFELPVICIRNVNLDCVFISMGVINKF